MKAWVTTSFAAFFCIPLVSAEPEPESAAQTQVRGRTAKNVLRAHLGVEGGTGPSCPLLKDDPTLPLSLPRGDFSVEFDLRDLHIVNELAFVNEGAAGTIKCLISTNRAAWVEVVTAHLVPDSRASRVNFVSSEARFVRMSFSVTTPGSIYSMGLFGLTVAADYTFTEIADFEKSADNEKVTFQDPAAVDPESDEISLTISPSNARIPWVSSLQNPALPEVEALELIDENSFTVCEFAAEDPSPSVIMDLQGMPTVQRVGVLYANQPGILRLRLLQTGDQRTEDAAQDSETSPEPDQAVEEFVFEDRQGIGRFAFDCRPTRTRYIEFIWEPNGPNDTPFSINEVAVFSQGSQKLLEQAPIRPIFSTRMDKTIVQGLVATGSEPTAATAAAAAPESPPQGSPNQPPDLELEPVSF